ncbi:MAG: MFS transporter [Candidatus Micrarchaeota archaeon]
MNERKNHQPDETSINRLMAVHMLYSFIVSALAVMVPLYLLEQKVDMAWIGLILSVGPLSFMIIRILLASMADEIGTKAIAVFYSVSNIIAVLFYLLFVSPLGFAFATLAEGVRASGFWAISRAEVFDANGRGNLGNVLARFSNMRQLADGLGRLAIGFMLAYLAFQGAFALILLISIALAILVLFSREKQNGKMHVDRNNMKRIFKKRPPTFWHAAVLQLFVWLPYNMLSGFLIPLYLIKSLDMGYQEVGITLALLSIATAAFALILMRIRLSKRTLFLLTLLSVPALVLMPLMGKDGLLLLVLLAIGTGATNIVGEYILVDQVYRSKDVNTDIGVLYAPLKVAEFTFLSMGGLVIANFGFTPLFFVLAASVALFVIFGRAVIKGHNHWTGGA